MSEVPHSNNFENKPTNREVWESNARVRLATSLHGINAGPDFIKSKTEVKLAALEKTLEAVKAYKPDMGLNIRDNLENLFECGDFVASQFSLLEIDKSQKHNKMLQYLIDCINRMQTKLDNMCFSDNVPDQKLMEYQIYSSIKDKLAELRTFFL